jgi:hypothetical protein
VESMPVRSNDEVEPPGTRFRKGKYAPFLLLFLVLLVAFSYTPPRWQDWNQNSRFNLTRSLVEQRTVRIDAYVENTGDYALIDGRAYTDKAPGLSLLAVPVHVVTSTLQPLGLSAASSRIGESESFSSTLDPEGNGLSQERIDEAVALYIATVITVAIPAAIMLVLLSWMVLHLTGCRTASMLAALLIGLATPVFAYSQAFYGHIPAAACLVGALALLILRDSEALSSRRLAAVGGLLALAVVIELPVAVAALPIAMWALVISGRRAIVFGLAGAIPPLVVLAVYDLVSFGTLTPVGYQHSALWQDQHSVGFMSMTYPRWDSVTGLLWSEFRGLLVYAPVLLLAIPGVVLMARSKNMRAPVVVIASSAGLFFLMIAASHMWWGGFSVGPRYLLPVVPFAAIPLGVTISWINSMDRMRRLPGLAGVLMLGALSGMVVWAATFAGQEYPPDSIQQPLQDYVYPLLRDGDVARNLGMAAGLNGVLSVLPLIAIVLAGVVAIGIALIRSTPDELVHMPGHQPLSGGIGLTDDIVTQMPFPTPQPSRSTSNN